MFKHSSNLQKSSFLLSSQKLANQSDKDDSLINGYEVKSLAGTSFVSSTLSGEQFGSSDSIQMEVLQPSNMVQDDYSTGSVRSVTCQSKTASSFNLVPSRIIDPNSIKLSDTNSMKCFNFSKDISKVSDKFTNKHINTMDRKIDNKISTLSLNDSLAYDKHKITSQTNISSLKMHKTMLGNPHGNDNSERHITLLQPPTLSSESNPALKDLKIEKPILNKSAYDSFSDKLSDTSNRLKKHPKSVSSAKDDELPFPGFEPKALYLFNQMTFPRKYCLMAVTWPWFERISMGIILINCITLGMYQPCDDQSCATFRCRLLEVFDHVIFVFFTIEMIVKVIAMGFFGKMAYLSDGWNKLDLFIVIAGAVEYGIDSQNLNLSAIRTIRVLRPLRAINRIPSMRILVMLLLDTLPMLGNVLLLCFFVFFIFGIVGVQLWSGLLRQRCHLELPHNVSIEGLNLSMYYMPSDTDKDYICSLPDDGGMTKCTGLATFQLEGQKCHLRAEPNRHYRYRSSSNGIRNHYHDRDHRKHYHEQEQYQKLRRYGGYQHFMPEDDLMTDSSSTSISSSVPTESAIIEPKEEYVYENECVNWNQYYTNCLPVGNNPFQGAISFDNIGYAWVAIFQVISLEGWVEIMYYVQDTHSFWDWIYFVLLIVIGAFFMINLCLVVIATQFSETKKRETERMLLERRRCQSSSSLVSLGEPGSCYHELLKYIERFLRRLFRRAVTQWNKYNQKQKDKQYISNSKTLDAIGTKNVNTTSPANQNEGNKCVANRKRSKVWKRKVLTDENQPCSPLLVNEESKIIQLNNQHNHNGNNDQQIPCYHRICNNKNRNPFILKTRQEKHKNSSQSFTTIGSNNNIANIASPPSLFPKYLLYKKRRPSKFSHFEDCDMSTHLSKAQTSSVVESNMAPRASPENSELEGNCPSSSLLTLQGIDVSLESLNFLVCKGSNRNVLNLQQQQQQQQHNQQSSIVLLGSVASKNVGDKFKLAETNSWTSCSNILNLAKGRGLISPNLHTGSKTKSINNSISCSHIPSNNINNCNSDSNNNSDNNNKNVKSHNISNKKGLLLNNKNYIISNVDHNHLQIPVILKRRASAPTVSSNSEATSNHNTHQHFYGYHYHYHKRKNSPTRRNQILPQNESVDASLSIQTMDSPTIMPIDTHSSSNYITRNKLSSSVSDMRLQSNTDKFISSSLKWSLILCDNRTSVTPVTSATTVKVNQLQTQLFQSSADVDKIITDTNLQDCLIGTKEMKTGSSLISTSIMNRVNQANKKYDNDVTSDDDDDDASGDEDNDTDYDKEGLNLKKMSCFTKIRQQVKRLVNSNIFQRGILFAILVNTVSMGVEFHNQPDFLTSIVEYSNLFFTALFTVEMFLKILAEGVFGYIRVSFNLFDGVIVILSLVELIQGGDGGLSVLRTFRLLRILKIVRFLPALRYQLLVMLKTMDNVATFFALLVLFIFIFSIMGMNLFGCKFCETNKLTGKRQCWRKNFDSLLWATITVFQILTQEDWNEVLYTGMAKTSSWAALYFIFLMTFGNYVLFNLLVAILVEGFASEAEERSRSKSELRNANMSGSEKQIETRTGNIIINKISQILPEKRKKQYGDDKHDIQVKNFQQNLPFVSITKVDTPSITDQWETSSKKAQQSDSQSEEEHLSRLGVPNIVHVTANSLISVCDENDIDRKRVVSLPASPLHDLSSPSKSSSHTSPPSKALSLKSHHHLYHHNHNHRNHQYFLPYHHQQKHQLLSSEYVTHHRNGEFHSAGLRVHPFKFPRHHSVGVVETVQEHHLKETSFKSSHRTNINFDIRDRLLPHSSVWKNSNWSNFKSGSITDSVVGNSLIKRTDKHNLRGDDDDDDNEDDVILQELLQPGLLDDDDGDLCNCWWCPEPRGYCKKKREHTFYVISPTNKIRRFCITLVSRHWFDYSILFFIALNCVTLAMERPDIPNQCLERLFLTVTNYIFTIIFATEMILKVMARGLIFGRHAYLNSGWNIMDGILVCISLIDIIISLVATHGSRIFAILRVFRILRTLRPLRVISQAPGLKLVVQTLLSSLRPIGNIVLICCTFFIIFGILGVQLFKGTFYYCDGPDVSDVINKTECQNKGLDYKWVNRKYNFDNLGQALMALFVLASKDGWVNIMYSGLDAVGVDQQPRINYNEWRLVYFISFLLLVGFFVLNMFVGVVVENFHKCQENQEMEERMAREQAQTKKKQDKFKKLLETPYWLEYSKWRLLINTITCSKYFDLSIAGIIGLNVITMALEYYLMPKELQFALKVLNFFFTSIFILEALARMISLGFVRYLVDSWNQLDVLIVALSLVGIALEEMKSGVIRINPTIIRVMRVLRIARVLKLLKMAKSVRALLDTVMQALPEVGNLGLLFFLLFFIFAALGVELFGRVECSELHTCEGLGRHAHFKNFGMAFLTLFRVATGDNWNGIMKDTLKDDCDPSDACKRNCCVSAFVAPVFFVAFVLMAQFVLVNVVVAVLMKHLEDGGMSCDSDDGANEGAEMDKDGINVNKMDPVASERVKLYLEETHKFFSSNMEYNTGETENLQNTNESKMATTLAESVNVPSLRGSEAISVSVIRCQNDDNVCDTNELSKKNLISRNNNILQHDTKPDVKSRLNLLDSRHLVKRTSLPVRYQTVACVETLDLGDLLVDNQGIPTATHL